MHAVGDNVKIKDREGDWTIVRIYKFGYCNYVVERDKDGKSLLVSDGHLINLSERLRVLAE